MAWSGSNKGPQTSGDRVGSAAIGKSFPASTRRGSQALGKTKPPSEPGKRSGAMPGVKKPKK